MRCMRWLGAIIIILAGSFDALLPGRLFAQTPEQYGALLDSNRLFALRDLVKHGSAPYFYRGAVEEAQNRSGPAIRDLWRAIGLDPHSKQAFEALEMLGNLNFREGKYREARDAAEQAHILDPNSADLNNMLPLLRSLADAPDMEVEGRGSRLQMRRDSDGSSGLPILINGKTVTYGFDTGAALSVMGTADAKMLGLAVKHVDMHLSEGSGTSIPGVDLAVAHDLVIGGMHWRNVPFFVLQDTGEPFVHVPIGSRGLLGLPVMITMGKFRWEPSGLFSFGSHVQSAKSAEQNLLFHGVTPIVQLRVKGKPLIFSLDTGAVDTDLNQGFATALPEIVEAGRKETRAITGMGGSNQYDSVLLGPVTFEIGGYDVTLSSPHVFPKHSLGSFDGNLGNDILKQAKAITLDFKRMSLQLE
jgi:predicted aspartyl protease